MTSVPFDLNVTITHEHTGKRERLDTVDFRFTTKTARALEIAAGAGIEWVIARGQSVNALVLLVCYGLQWADKKMTEQKAIDIIDAYLASARPVKDLSEAAVKALRLSGVYGHPDDEGASGSDEGAGERPLATTAETTPSAAG